MPLIPIYYRAPDGVEPVGDFIGALEGDERREKLRWTISLLTKFADEEPPFPHSSHIRSGLRELRCHYGRELYRVLYRRFGEFAVLLHAFRKNVQKTPPEDITLAEERWDDLTVRMEADPRVPPRALGHDAP